MHSPLPVIVGEITEYRRCGRWTEKQVMPVDYTATEAQGQDNRTGGDESGRTGPNVREPVLLYCMKR
ncbi:hypothetical protein EA58_18940 [Photobacterium galatheae]|uniref:Uncharacterized protein n=1 Tax=Photobacterium galatheae TaxID=1654360 RepID=A0A066RHT9_9GAMM|nr:hypothetical protein EA58_18940 [Photobacterium galatheae]